MLANTKTSKSKQELKTFGLTMAAFIALIFGFVLPWTFDWNASIYPWLLSFTFASAAIIYPRMLAPVFSVWMIFGETLAKINTYIILLLVYVFLFIPIGVVLKLLRYDPLQRRKNIMVSSFRVVRETPLDKSSLENPF